jgi:hypothetical protein
MDTLILIDPPWADAAAAFAVVCGLVFVWRGLFGGRDGREALLRRRIGMLPRMEGFRLTVFGLALIGIGAATIVGARWLLLLSLGIGFVEILESSTLIAVWKWGSGRPRM